MADPAPAKPAAPAPTIPDHGGPVAAPTGEPPPQLGEWHLQRKLGVGGMGSVHLALNSDGHLGALKLMHPNLAAVGDFRPRFLREATVLAKVRHPNLVELLDHGEQAGWLYLVMEFLPGGDLDRHLKHRGQLFEKEAVQLAIGACRGLAALHAAGLIHRDIKPENIFLGPPPKPGEAQQPKIGDLGMARQDSGDDRMTLTGTACGTPAYMAPEQIRGHGDLDGRVDVYALGATLFTLLTGRRPFEGGTIYVLTHEVLTKAPPDMRKYNPQLSAQVCGVVAKAMAKDRAERHRSAGELLADLECLVAGRTLLHSAPIPFSPTAVFAEVAGQPAPRHGSSSHLPAVGGGGGLLEGIDWAPFLRLLIPAGIGIALLAGATWWLGNRTAGEAGKAGAKAASAVEDGLQHDQYGPQAKLAIGPATAVLRWCPPGRFQMGSPADEPGREECERQHLVTLGRGFWILHSEVTMGMWGGLIPDAVPDASEADLPANEVSLADCQEFLDRLNQLHPGLEARLPTEAEWEYACRAGSDGPVAVANPPPRWCMVPAILAAWKEGGQFAAENALAMDADHPQLRPSAVAMGTPNAWGIHDMSGNLAEWCADRWDGAAQAPSGSDPLSQFGAKNIIRGGSWFHPPARCRSAARDVADAEDAKPWLGFRFVVPGGLDAQWPVKR